jgi:hypothetical protein
MCRGTHPSFGVERSPPSDCAGSDIFMIFPRIVDENYVSVLKVVWRVDSAGLNQARQSI